MNPLSTGECPQYLGMISKHQKDVLEVDSFFTPPQSRRKTDTILSVNNLLCSFVHVTTKPLHLQMTRLTLSEQNVYYLQTIR